VAPNALHNSSARYDAPKCDEDTRVEVTKEIMDHIQDRSAPQRILCMTGAAGSGKSALQQTIAERCDDADILGAAFFFSSTDPTRNTAYPVVGTIAYQLGLKHRLFRSAIGTAVNDDPLIFSRSIQAQMKGLIVQPFKNLRRTGEIDTDTFPYAILIDGLDECKREPIVHRSQAEERQRGEDVQAELLAAISHCILNNDLPFRVVIASRPELAIRTALEPGGHLHQEAYHLQLSDKYDASGDMQ
jgi:ABC-type dipeptide/oligopeptide/nickel transport system ATPase component